MYFVSLYQRSHIYLRNKTHVKKFLFVFKISVEESHHFEVATGPSPGRHNYGAPVEVPLANNVQISNTNFEEATVTV
jgi:hypothetical protein